MLMVMSLTFMNFILLLVLIYYIFFVMNNDDTKKEKILIEWMRSQELINYEIINALKKIEEMEEKK